MGVALDRASPSPPSAAVRAPEARSLLRDVSHWTLLTTCDHDGVVSCYRTLKGLSDLHRGLVMDLNPFAIGKMNGARVASGQWEYDQSPELGANARWGITPNLALDAASKIKAGSVWVNSTNLFDGASGFGGYRESGFGREGGKEGLHEYLRPKWQSRLRPTLPTAGCTNGTLTFVALTLRSAERIAQEGMGSWL